MRIFQITLAFDNVLSKALTGIEEDEAINFFLWPIYLPNGPNIL